MARLIQAGQFVGRGEERAAAVLERELPDTWTVICNKELVNPDGSSVEVDFIIVGKHAVYVVEEKSWQGPIHGNSNGWVLASGESHKSPLDKAAFVARRVAGLLRGNVPRLKDTVGDAHFVFPRVILSSDDVQIYVQDTRVAIQVLKLSQAAERLRQADEQQAGPTSVKAFHGEIIRCLTELPNRPRVPKRIGDYEVLEMLDERGPVRTLRARHADGSERLLKLVRRPETGDVDKFLQLERTLLREYEVLKRLGEKAVAPRVEHYFSWEDGTFWVIPICPVEGDSLRSHRSAAVPTAKEILPVVESAFRSLANVHQEGVVHRALSPDRIVVEERDHSPWVIFTDFVIARIQHQETIASKAEEMKLDPDCQYRAPECKLALELAEPTSDVYSLAASLFFWVTGFEPDVTKDVPAFPPLTSQRTDIPEDDAKFLQRLFSDCLQEDAKKRPSAREVLARIEQERQRRETAKRKSLSEELIYEEGEQIDDQHQIVRHLGRGATADSYLARDLVAEEFRVLKRIRNQELYEILSKSEFQALQRLHHRNLPRVYDIRPWTAPFHLKLEYVPGCPLRELQSALAGDVATCLRIARDVLSALQYLSEQGLTHRDVSPSNIIVPDEADLPIKLIDFGLATRQPGTHEVVGTPAYRAPEVEQGHPWTPLADLYSVGVLLFETLTGRLPYEIDDERRYKDRLLTPSVEEQQQCGERLLGTLLKAVAPRPEQRFQSADEFLNALERAVSAERVKTAKGSQVKNPFVDQLRRTYRNSRIGNTNNRGLDSKFCQETYVETRLDTDLMPQIIDGRYRLVILSGNPGDGKTAFLQRLHERLRETGGVAQREDETGWIVRRQGHAYAALYDASESHGEMSADELFHRLLEPLSGRDEPAAGYTACAAVNDGRLRDFFERNGQLRYRWLWDRLRLQMEGCQSEQDGVLLIDMKRRCLAATNPAVQSLFTGILDRFLAAECWKPCDACVARQECPIWWNVQSLRDEKLGPQVRQRLHHLLLAVHLRRERRPTIRDLRSALAFLLTHDLGCEEIHRERAEGQSPLSDPSRLYFDAAFNGSGSPDLVLDELQHFDPALVASPRLERYLHFHRTREVAGAVEHLFCQAADRPTIAFHGLEDARRIEALKRRYLFEARKPEERPAGMPDPDRLNPYHHFHRFVDAINGRIDIQQLRDELLAGISRADGVPVLPELSGLGLRLTEASSQQLVVIKRFPPDEFELCLPPAEDTRVETVPDYLVLQRRGGSPRLVIGLDLFEYLQRALEGYVSGAEEQQALFEELEVFKNQLLAYPTQEVLMIESGCRMHRVVVRDGKIVREGTTV